MFALYSRMNMHVSATDMQVIRAVYARLNPDMRRLRQHRDARHDIYRRVLACHHQHRKLVREFRL